MRATKANIHLDNFRFNFETVRALVGRQRGICVPVKADAYGHGAVPLARAAVEAGAAFLAVATVDEGAELRRAGLRAPILLFSVPAPEELGLLVESELTPFVPDAGSARAISAAAGKKELPVHLKLDTGMGRVGCRPEDALGLARVVRELGNLRVQGAATHLAVADSRDARDRAFTAGQLEAFAAAVAALRGAGWPDLIAHAANSGGVALHPESWLDLVRPGIALYGYPPVDGLGTAFPLKPVMELETQLSFIKKVRKGESVSYGRTWTAPRDTWVGTLTIGYGDGLSRRLSNKLKVDIGGRSYPQVGRICMDQCMVDLGPEPAPKLWDKATVFGAAPGCADAAGLAALIETIPYEVTCAVARRVPRVYLGA